MEQFGYVLDFLKKMMPYALLFTAAYLPLRIGFVRRQKRSSAAAREVALYLFFLALLCVTSQTVLESLSTFSPENFYRKLSGERLNLIPGRIFLAAKGSAYVGVIGLLGNLFILTPPCFLLPLLFPKVRLWKTVLFALALSLGFEILQLPLDRGFDVDDLWLNTLGGLLGHLAAWPIPRIFPKFAASLRGES